MADDFKEYLQALLTSCGTREACLALGYGSNSYSSLRALCEAYGVSIPERSNQHASIEPPAPVPPKPQRIHKPAQRRQVGVERCVVVGDLHVPYQDDDAISLALAIIEDLQPEVVIFNGDVWDAYQVSRFSREPSRAVQMQADLDQTACILARFRGAAPDAEMRFVRGNHESRLERYLCDEAPALHGLRDLRIENLLHLDELDIEYVGGRGKEAYTRYGEVLVGHFDRVNQKAGYTASLLLDKHAASLVQGHTHRGGIVYRTYPDGRQVAGVEGFCLCDCQPEYVSDPDWMNGLVIVTKRTDTDRFHITPVPFVDGEALYADTLYTAEEA